MQRISLLLLTVSWLATGCAPAGAPGSPDPSKRVLLANPAPDALFSPAIAGGGLVFLAGQLGRIPGTRTLVEGGVQAETRQALENIRSLLAQVELGLEDAVKCTVFLADIADYGAMNEVYREFFPADPPARSAFAVTALALDARVEIECIAAAHAAGPQ